MTHIYAYLSFTGKCREAMTFYNECLGGKLTLMTIAESPMAAQFPPDQQQLVLHSSLEKDELALMATDMHQQGELIRGNNVALSLVCSTEEEMNKFFSALSAGGKVTHPLSDFFAGRMGAFTDKFGMEWMVYYDNSGKNKN